MKKSKGQLPMFDVEPTACDPRAPSDLSSLSRLDAEQLHQDAARARELAALLKRANLRAEELKIGRRLARLRLPLVGADRSWLEVVLEACSMHGVLLEEILSTKGRKMGPRGEARDRAFHEIRRFSGRAYEEIGRAFDVGHNAVMDGCRRHQARLDQGAAPAPSAPRAVPGPAKTWLELEATEESQIPPSGRSARAAG